MVDYYVIILAIVLLFQSTSLAKRITLMTIVFILSMEWVSTILEVDYSLYENITICSVIIFVISTVTYPLHNNKVIPLVYLASILWNLTASLTKSIEIQWFIYDNYKIFNKIQNIPKQEVKSKNHESILSIR